MPSNDNLADFVRGALACGASRAQIEEVLLKAQWRPEQIRSALSGFAEVEFPVPVPRPRPYLSAREAFLYLVLFTTLYTSAFNLGALFFQFIDRAFPDPAAGRELENMVREAIRWSVASLVVSFPIFLYLTSFLNGAMRRDPGKRGSKIRKWLTYMTLFLAAGVLIGDFTTLIHGLLGGGLTARFLLKSLTVAVIAGTAFGYYLRDLRKEEREVAE